MNNTKKVIACLYAGIVAANAMDENVIERETPDGMPKNISSAEVPVNANIITVSDKEEQQYGAFSDYLDNLDNLAEQEHVDNQNQAQSTVATIRNANNDANKQNKTVLKEVLDKPEAPSIFSAVKEVNNAGYKQNKIAIKEVDFDKISQRSKANIKINPHERIDVSKYITIKGEYAQHFYTITGLKINERELRNEGKHITIDYDILGKTQYEQTYISPTAFSELKSDYLRINLNFLPLDGTNVIFPEDCSQLFANSPALCEVNFSSAEFSPNKAATSAKYMFKDCANLHRITFGNFNTGRITDMSYMFAGCSSLEVLDLSKFNTINVTSMQSMFNKCRALKELNLSYFNTSNVTDMEDMFADCHGLEILDLSHFNTENVTNMSDMFGGCFALKKLDISCFCTSNVQNMSYMFYGCALENLDLSYFNTEKVKNMEGMFLDCNQIKTLNFGGAVNETLRNTIWMFRRCVNLVQLDLSGFKNQFNNEQTTKDFKLSEFDDGMFMDCTGLSNANKNRTVKAEQCVLDYIEKVLSQNDKDTAPVETELND